MPSLSNDKRNHPKNLDRPIRMCDEFTLQRRRLLLARRKTEIVGEEQHAPWRLLRGGIDAHEYANRGGDSKHGRETLLRHGLHIRTDKGVRVRRPI